MSILQRNKSSLNKKLDNTMLGFYFLIFSIITGIYYAYAITNGNMNLLETSLLGCTYTSMWDNFLVGRVDVDPGCISYEGFYLPDGKAYTYFAMFPSFLRGFIEIFFQRGSTDWSKVSIVLGGLLAVSASTLAYYQIANKLSSKPKSVLFYTSIFAITMALGSPITSHMATGWIYNESSIWGLAWSLVFILFFTQVIIHKKVTPTILFLLSLSSSFAMLSKITFGICTGIALTLLLTLVLLQVVNKKLSFSCIDKILKYFPLPGFELSTKKVVAMMASGFIPLLISILFTLGLNYARWGNLFEFSPFEYSDIMQISRKLSLEEAGLYNPKRIPHSFVYYFIPEPFHFSKEFPHIKIEGYMSGLQKFFPPIFIDWIDPANPLVVNSPCFFLFSILGIFSFLKVFDRLGLILMFVFGVQFIMILAYAGLSLRYLTETMPLLTVLSLASFQTLINFEKNKKIRILSSRAFFSFLTMIGIYTAAITILQLKIWTWSVPDEVKEGIKTFFNNVQKKD